MKYSTFIAQSKDGFIATKNGDTSWLHKIKIEGDAGYGEYYSSVDCIIMGKRTYEHTFVDRKNAWPYGSKPAIVLSDKKYKDSNVLSFDGDLEQLDKELISKGYKSAWVMGGAKVVNDYIENGMMKAMVITTVERNIVEGVKLFENIEPYKLFELRDTIKYGDATNRHYVRKEQ